jgi:uncharacterized phage infection (PIP) family protein YhgE
MYEFIERLQAEIAANSLIEFFCWALVIVAGLALASAFFTKDRRLLGFAAAAPTLLPTLGLVGTFIGIFVGLMDFDPENIDESVPPLLLGLKIAFVTSIVGMALGVIVRVLLFFQPRRDAGEEVSEGQFLSVFAEIRDAGQLTTRHIANLENKFDGFAAQIGDAAVEQLARALEKATGDFNAQINDKVGENFQKLNGAVEKLVEWQTNHADDIGSTRAALDEAGRSIAESAEAFNEVKLLLAAVAEPFQGVRDLLVEINAQRTEMTGSLEAFAKLKTDAEKSLPLLEDKLNSLYKLNSLSEKLADAIEDAQSRMTAFDQHMQEELKRAIEIMGSHLGAISAELAKDYTPLIRDLRELREASSRTSRP